MKKNWYDEAIEDILVKQRSDVSELEAAIFCMESSEDKSELHFKMLAEYKQELAEAVDNLRSAEQYVESMKKYVA